MSRFAKIWEYVATHFQGDDYSLHGIDHWRRVHRNARILQTRTGADRKVIELFAAFHDSCRVNECTDPGHGGRGAELARQLRGRLFDLSDEQFDQLHFACTWHTDELFHEDVTIATCWDADRLDLGRVGVSPAPECLNTDYAKELARSPGLNGVLSELEDRLQSV